MRTEIIKNLKMSEYRSMPGLSKHELDALQVCPEYFAWKQKQDWKPSRQMVLGTLVHDFVLEGKRNWAEAPACDKRTTAGKAIWQAFCEENVDRVVVTAEEAASVQGSCDAALKAMDKVIIDCVEASMFWERDGVQCKGRPDIRGTIDGKRAIVDLKTTSEILRFDSKFWSFGYDRQAEWYLDGEIKVTGENKCGFAFLAVDMSEPYLTQWIEVSKRTLNEAKIKNDTLLDLYKTCQKAGSFNQGMPFRLI